MRHAFLIIAHNNWWQLKNLVQLLDYPGHDIYIHIDKKSRDFTIQEFDGITRDSDLHIFQQYQVFWGGYSQVQTELFLLEQAGKFKYDYYHVISGADLPLKSNEEFDHFFERNRGKEFIDFDEEALKNSPEIGRRTRLYHFLQNYRRRYRLKAANEFFICLERISLGIQIMLRVNRVRHLDWTVKYGSNWVSITDSLVRTILGQQAKIKRVFSYTNCADELFIQTIAFNHGFKDSIYRADHSGRTANMRYIDWKRGVNGNPYTFTMADYGVLRQADALFARKFSEAADKEIIEKLSSECSARTRA